MNKLPAFSLHFYEFECDSILTEKLLEKAKNIDYTVFTSNKQSASEFFDLEFIDWLENCLLEVKKDLRLPEQLNLVVTQCWSNKTTKLTQHHLHAHPNSLFSGVFYLTDAENDGLTYFYYQHQFFAHHQNTLLVETKNTPLVEYVIKPKKGKLIIFPSFVSHKVPTLRENTERYTISFNTFYEGTISSEYSSSLTIECDKIRDRYK